MTDNHMDHLKLEEGISMRLFARLTVVALLALCALVASPSPVTPGYGVAHADLCTACPPWND